MLKIQAYHPGLYIKRYMEGEKLDAKKLSKALEFDKKELRKIIKCETGYSKEFIEKISKYSGISSSFFYDIEERYEDFLKYQSLLEEKRLIKTIDKQFAKLVIERNRLSEKDENIAFWRRFLKVFDLKELNKPDNYAFYREGTTLDDKKDTTFLRNVWVTTAVQEALKLDVKEFDESKLKKNINYYRTLTNLPLDEAVFLIEESLKECGVSFITLPKLQNANIAGVVRRLDDKHVLVALSGYGQTNDKFWFNLFHELRHVIQKKKDNLAVNGEEYDKELEKDANKFARDILIKPKKYKEFIEQKDFTYSAIELFAEENDIHPAIVVGRLQKEGRVPFSYLNSLKVKFDMNKK